MTRCPCHLLIDIGDRLAEVMPDQAEAFYLEALERMESTFGEEAALLVLPKLCDFYFRQGWNLELDQTAARINELKHRGH